MRTCKECGAEIAANTSEIYLPEAVNPRHAEPGQPFYFELCPACFRKYGHKVQEGEKLE